MSNIEKSNSYKMPEWELIQLIKDFLQDSAEQTHALKKLADSYTKIADTGATKEQINELKRVLDNVLIALKDIDKLSEIFNRYQEDSIHYKLADEQITDDLKRITNELDKMTDNTSDISSKSGAYLTLIKEFIDQQAKKDEYKHDIDKINKENKWKLIIAVVGGLFGVGGVLSIILSNIL